MKYYNIIYYIIWTVHEVVPAVKEIIVSPLQQPAAKNIFLFLQGEVQLTCVVFLGGKDTTQVFHFHSCLTKLPFLI